MKGERSQRQYSSYLKTQAAAAAAAALVTAAAAAAAAADITGAVLVTLQHCN